MNLRYRLPSHTTDPALDPALEPVKAWLSENGIPLNDVPMGCQISINEKRATMSFFGFVRQADGKRALQRNHRRGMVKRRITYPILTMPSAEIGQIVSR